MQKEEIQDQANSQNDKKQLSLDYPKNDDEEDEDDGIQIVRHLETFQSPQMQQLKCELHQNGKKQHIQIRKLPIRKDKVKESSQYFLEKQIRDFFKKGKFNEIYMLSLHDKNKYQEYDNMRYQGETYKVGQNVLINNANNSNDDFVGKITKIMTVKEQKSQKYICLCEVKWFYKKNEIIKVKPGHKNWISQNEIFLTHQTDIIQATAIKGPCSILNIEEYERLDHVEKGVYFQRLTWIPGKNKFEEWDSLEFHCLCKQPINPDLSYIQCDVCDEWYHMNCVGVKNSEWEKKEYICGRCR